MDLPFCPEATETAVSSCGSGVCNSQASTRAWNDSEPIRSQRCRRAVAGLSCANIGRVPAATGLQVATLMLVRRRGPDFVKRILQRVGHRVLGESWYSR